MLLKSRLAGTKNASAILRHFRVDATLVLVGLLLIEACRGMTVLADEILDVYTESMGKPLKNILRRLFFYTIFYMFDQF